MIELCVNDVEVVYFSSLGMNDDRVGLGNADRMDLLVGPEVACGGVIRSLSDSEE